MNVIENFFEEKKEISFHNRKTFRNVIANFLEFIELNNLVDENHYNEIYIFFNKKKESLELKVEKEESKTPEIPIKLFNNLINCANKILDNPNSDFNEKREACVILILSQTGIRISELRLLKRNAIEEISIFDNSENVYYMTYVSPKAKKKKAKTFLTNIAKKAYDYMASATNKDNEYLFVKENGEIYSTSRLRHWIALFCIRNFKEIGCLNMSVNKENGLSIIKYDDFNNENTYVPIKLRKINKNDYIAYPTPHQFRVSVCNWLIRNGRGIDWVREHMNHLEYETTLHYIRRRDEDKKEKKVARDILKAVVKKEVKLIGKDSDILTEKINEFIKKENYNVEKDIDTIIDKLQGKIPIRQKASGYCIKSSFGRKCSHDSYSDDIYCAFGVCPNHFTTYKMVDISYKTFCELKCTINYNLENKFLAQANMELNKLKRVINEALLPELEELRKEIENKGVEEIVSDNKNIKWIIENLNFVFGEITEWKMKKIIGI